MNEIEINGKQYILKSTIKTEKRESIENKKLVMVRTYSAGVHYGYLKKRVGKEVILQDARRVWYWKGAASLSQLAQEGTSDPNSCKFPCAVDEIVLTEAIEIISITSKAKESLDKVKEWKQ